MAMTARTPPIGRLASTSRPAGPSQAPPSRSQPQHIRPLAAAPSRPDTPSFLDPNVAGVFSNLIPQASTSNSAFNAAVRGVVPPKKRAVEVVDLTNTTDGQSSEPLLKKTRQEFTLNPPPPVTNPSLVPPKRKGGLAPTASAREREREAAQARREKQDAHDKLNHESAQWRAKYKKAFPAFVFYFDQLDPATEASLGKQVKQLGAKTPGFFSKEITHVVTSRNSIPLPPIPANKENAGAGDPATGQQKAGSTSKADGTRAFLGAVGGERKKTFSMTDSANPFIDNQDILQKAAEFGLKIWKVEKIQRVLARINSHSPSKDSLARNLSLPSLLRDEQLFGTRERDPFVPRADTHYFPSKACYILVEDSTGEHRPITIKEYDRPRRGEDPPWPVLWGGIEGRGGFYHYEGPPIVYERKVPPAKGQKEQPTYGTAAARAVGGAPALRRAASLNQLSGARKAQQASAPGGDYLAASGNSMSITSNIASGTSTRSGALAKPYAGGGLMDKRVQMLSRNTVSSALSRSSAAKEGVELGKLKRSASIDTGLNERVPPPRDEPKKPGYCENCRIKYDDFKDHVLSKKHRKFAKNPANWAELDRLLDQIERPLAPEESLPPSSQESEGSTNSYTGEGEADEYDEGSEGLALAGDDSGYFEVGYGEDECASSEEMRALVMVME